MISIRFPPPEFRIITREGSDYIFDKIRKSWIKLTPEEWVRQNVIAYLCADRGVPQSLIAIERKVQVGELARRFDIVVYSREAKPWLLVECKAGTVALGSDTVGQVLSYISKVQSPFFMITNGIQTYGWQKENNAVIPLAELPLFH